MPCFDHVLTSCGLSRVIRIQVGRVSRNEAVGRSMIARRLRRRGPGLGDNVRRSHASASGWLRNETRRLSLMRVIRVNSGTAQRNSAPKLQGFIRTGGVRHKAANLVVNVSNASEMPDAGWRTGSRRQSRSWRRRSMQPAAGLLWQPTKSIGRACRERRGPRSATGATRLSSPSEQRPPKPRQATERR